MPPSKEALRHSGGDSLLFTSAMVTLYLEVELSSDSRPGTEQNRSVGFTTHVPPANKHNTLVTTRFSMDAQQCCTPPCQPSAKQPQWPKMGFLKSFNWQKVTIKLLQMTSVASSNCKNTKSFIKLDILILTTFDSSHTVHIFYLHCL